MNTTHTSLSPEQTEAIGRSFAQSLRDEGCTGAVIALRGELGVGKTAFTRGFASAFGIVHVKSPTYTIVNEYRSDTATIFHFDMYRIEDEDDLYGIGFDEYLGRDAFCLLEWSENVEDALPRERYTVTIARTDPKKPNERTVTIQTEVNA